MAVSHQWFIQWSEPSVIFADITSKYNNVNNWHQFERETSEPDAPENGESFNYLTPDTSRELLDTNIYRDSSEKLRHNGKSKAAGLTLWLTMLGVAQPQSVPADTDTPPFNTLYKWKQFDFEFPSPRVRELAISTGKFVPENVIPLGIEVWGSRVFVTMPMWRRGVPATLATVPRAGGLASPPLKPYPDWSFHRAFNDGNCSGLTSVFRLKADPCGRLWVVDSGQIDLQDSPKQVCPPSITVFDLRTDALLARYRIPDQFVLQDSLYANIAVDARADDCSDLHAYIADPWRFGLLVFRERDERFWRFSNPLFYPDPLAANFTLHGVNFQWADGVFGLALSPLSGKHDRILFFNSLASYRQFFVFTSVLQDPLIVNKSANMFHLLGESRGLLGQASASAMDRRGVLYNGLVMRDSVGCWDSNKLYRKRTQGIVASNRETLVFPNDVKVDDEPQQSVWVITNRLPIFQDNIFDPDDYNYRIMYVNTEEAVRGTVCDPDVKGPPPSSVIQRGWLP